MSTPDERTSKGQQISVRNWHDLFFQIACQLPVESVMRFGSCCQEFYSMVTSTKFIEEYIRVAKEERPMLLIEDVGQQYSSNIRVICMDQSLVPTDINFDSVDPHGIVVKASCAGLICCASLRNQHRLHVFNPATRRTLSIPPYRRLNLPPHYNGDAKLFGVAVDLSQCSFKIVVAGPNSKWGFRPFNSFLFRIFDSTTYEWVSFEDTLADTFNPIDSSKSVFLHGSVHWLSNSPSYILAVNLSLHVSKNINTSSPQIIPSPSLIGATWKLVFV